MTSRGTKEDTDQTAEQLALPLPKWAENLEELLDGQDQSDADSIFGTPQPIRQKFSQISKGRLKEAKRAAEREKREAMREAQREAERAAERGGSKMQGKEEEEEE